MFFPLKSSNIPRPSRVVQNWNKYWEKNSTLNPPFGGGAFGWVAENHRKFEYEFFRQNR